jgi:hypothetical protein
MKLYIFPQLIYDKCVHMLYTIKRVFSFFYISHLIDTLISSDARHFSSVSCQKALHIYSIGKFILFFLQYIDKSITSSCPMSVFINEWASSFYDHRSIYLIVCICNIHITSVVFFFSLLLRSTYHTICSPWR